MVGHLAVGMDNPIKAFADLFQYRQKLNTILVLKENILPPISSGRNVVQSAGIFKSQWSCHVISINKNVGMLELTPFFLLSHKHIVTQ